MEAELTNRADTVTALDAGATLATLDLTNAFASPKPVLMLLALLHPRKKVVLLAMVTGDMLYADPTATPATVAPT